LESVKNRILNLYKSTGRKKYGVQEKKKKEEDTKKVFKFANIFANIMKLIAYTLEFRFDQV